MPPASPKMRSQALSAEDADLGAALAKGLESSPVFCSDSETASDSSEFVSLPAPLERESEGSVSKSRGLLGQPPLTSSITSLHRSSLSGQQAPRTRPSAFQAIGATGLKRSSYFTRPALQSAAAPPMGDSTASERSLCSDGGSFRSLDQRASGAMESDEKGASGREMLLPKVRPVPHASSGGQESCEAPLEGKDESKHAGGVDADVFQINFRGDEPRSLEHAPQPEPNSHACDSPPLGVPGRELACAEATSRSTPSAVASADAPTRQIPSTLRLRSAEDAEQGGAGISLEDLDTLYGESFPASPALERVSANVDNMIDELIAGRGLTWTQDFNTDMASLCNLLRRLGNPENRDFDRETATELDFHRSLIDGEYASTLDLEALCDDFLHVSEARTRVYWLKDVVNTDVREFLQIARSTADKIRHANKLARRKLHRSIERVSSLRRQVKTLDSYLDTAEGRIAHLDSLMDKLEAKTDAGYADALADRMLRARRLSRASVSRIKEELAELRETVDAGLGRLSAAIYLASPAGALWRDRSPSGRPEAHH